MGDASLLYRGSCIQKNGQCWDIDVRSNGSVFALDIHGSVSIAKTHMRGILSGGWIIFETWDKKDKFVVRSDFSRGTYYEHLKSPLTVEISIGLADAEEKEEASVGQDPHPVPGHHPL